MKRRNLLILFYLLLTNLVQAQQNDSDGDGIPDSEDLCPAVAGTKANKGCPEDKTAKKNTTKPAIKNNAPTSSTSKNSPQKLEYISKDVLNKLLNALCTSNLKSIASNQYKRTQSSAV